MDEQARDQQEEAAQGPETAPPQPSGAQPDREAVPPRPSLGLACVGGLTGAVAGAALWAIVASFLGVRAFWMAIAVGVAVGLLVRFLGRGREAVFGGLAVIFTLIGLLFGSLFMFLDPSSDETGRSMLALFAELRPPLDYLLVLQNGFVLLELERLKAYALVCDAVAPVIAFFLAFLRAPKAR